MAKMKKDLERVKRSLRKGDDGAQRRVDGLGVSLGLDELALGPGAVRVHRADGAHANVLLDPAARDRPGEERGDLHLAGDHADLAHEIEARLHLRPDATQQVRTALASAEGDGGRADAAVMREPEPLRLLLERVDDLSVRDRGNHRSEHFVARPVPANRCLRDHDVARFNAHTHARAGAHADDRTASREVDFVQDAPDRTGTHVVGDHTDFRSVAEPAVRPIFSVAVLDALSIREHLARDAIRASGTAHDDAPTRQAVLSCGHMVRPPLDEREISICCMCGQWNLLTPTREKDTLSSLALLDKTATFFYKFPCPRKRDDNQIRKGEGHVRNCHHRCGASAN